MSDESWGCPACGEEVEAGFDACWSCGSAPDGTRDDDFARAGERAEALPSAHAGVLLPALAGPENIALDRQQAADEVRVGGGRAPEPVFRLLLLSCGLVLLAAGAVFLWSAPRYRLERAVDTLIWVGLPVGVGALYSIFWVLAHGRPALRAVERWPGKETPFLWAVCREGRPGLLGMDGPDLLLLCAGTPHSIAAGALRALEVLPPRGVFPWLRGEGELRLWLEGERELRFVSSGVDELATLLELHAGVRRGAPIREP